MVEPDEIRAILSQKTGAPFRVATPLPHDPVSRENPKWFVICPDINFARQTGHARAAWADMDGNVWIGSDIIGDSIAWLEAFYGEEYQEPKLDYSALNDAEFRTEFGNSFPRVLDHIKNLESIAAKVSAKDGVHLEIKRSGSKDILVFTLAARIDAQEFVHRPLNELVDGNLRALKEAHDEIVAV